jgi:N,N'-diacetyllegionaminate synthase
MNKVLIVAETGINHNGKVGLLKQMIDAAWLAGVDFIKFQKYKTDEFIKPDNQDYDMFKACEFSDENWLEIIRYCDKSHVSYFFTPQNKTDLDFLIKYTQLEMIKIGSDDLTNIELIEYCAIRQKPMIISTGMAYKDEIEEAKRACYRTRNFDLMLLHCTSSYPTMPEDVNMRKLGQLRDYAVQAVKVGYSDHTQGYEAALMAVSLGASMIEKHFTLDNRLYGPDHWFSANPKEMEQLVYSIRKIELMFGSSELKPTDEELKMRKRARRKKNEKGEYFRESV